MTYYEKLAPTYGQGEVIIEYVLKCKQASMCIVLNNTPCGAQNAAYYYGSKSLQLAMSICYYGYMVNKNNAYLPMSNG